MHPRRESHPSRRCASGGHRQRGRRGMPIVAAVAQDTRRQNMFGLAPPEFVRRIHEFTRIYGEWEGCLHRDCFPGCSPGQYRCERLERAMYEAGVR